MSLFRSNIEKKAIAFIDQIDLLAKASIDPEEKQYLEHQIKEARHFIEYNEWYVGFEILTDNLHEINYKMDQALIDSARDIFLQADPTQSEETLWWLNELRKD